MDNGASPPGNRRSSRPGASPRAPAPADPRTEPSPGAEPGDPADGRRRDNSGSMARPDRPARRGGPRRVAVVESDAAELESIPQAEPAAVVAPDRADLNGELAGPVLLPPIRITDPSAPGRPVVHRVLEDPVTQPVETVRSTPESVDVLRAPVTGLVANKVAVPPSLPPAAVGAAGATMLNPVAEQSLPQRVGRPSITFQRRSTRPRVRRVTRVIRHVDTWSVFKVALVFNAFLYAVALTSGVLLWHVAVATGTIDNVEKFFEGFGWSSFQFRGGQIYHNAWIGGLFVAIGLTGLAVLLATLFNLITDLVGGVRVSVLEEEVLARRDRTAAVVLESAPAADMPYDQADSG